MSNDLNLLPCPFCASERVGPRSEPALHIACRDCGAQLWGHRNHFPPNGERAAEAWNRRAQPAAAPAAEPETMEEIHRQERQRPYAPVLPADPTLPSQEQAAPSDDVPEGCAARDSDLLAAIRWYGDVKYAQGAKLDTDAQRVAERKAWDDVYTLLCRHGAQAAAHGALLPIEYRYDDDGPWCQLGPAERMLTVEELKGKRTGRTYRLADTGEYPVWKGDSPQPAASAEPFGFVYQTAPDTYLFYPSQPPAIINSWRETAVYAAPVAAQAKPEGVTLDGCLETLFRLGEYLGVDYAASRKSPGAPSSVYIQAIEAKIASKQQHGAATGECKYDPALAAQASGQAQDAEDAARYRWLRNHPLDGLEETTPCIRAADNDSKHWALNGNDADAAIDAARQESKGGEGNG